MTIRMRPEDFVVRERLAEGVVRDVQCAHTVIELNKRSLTTEHACAMLARAMGVRAGVIARAGMKDKHALTTQHVSVPCELVRSEDRWSGAGWSARVVGWCDAPLSAASIACNEFEVVVRALTRERIDVMDSRAAALRDRDALVVVNYFGAQRFGSARHGAGFAGAALVRGDFETSLRLLIATPHRKDMGVKRAFTRALASGWGEWARLAVELPRCPERRAVESLAGGMRFRDAFAALPYSLQELAIDAYQSHLWNRAARSLLARHVNPQRCFVSEDDYGPMVFPHAGAIPPALRELDAPLPSPGLPAGGEWGEGVLGVLREDGLTLEQLRVPGLRRPRFSDAHRCLFVRANQITLSAPASDAPTSRVLRYQRTLRFSLPSSSYATVVLRALGE